MAEELKQQNPAPGNDAVEAVKDEEQAPGVQAQEEEAPEFFLDEEGNLQGSFDDWFNEPGEQEESGEEAKASDEPSDEEAPETETQPQEPQPQYYTPEELARLEIDQIDPTRLPPEVRPYYEAILKETQAEQVQPQTPDEKALYDQIQQVAKQRVEQLLGEPFDELNPKHIAALAVEANKVAQQFEKQLRAQQKVAELARQEPYFRQIDELFQQKLMELPFKEAIKIQQALAEGDIDAVLPLWEEARKEFYATKLGIQQNQPAQARPEVAAQPQPAPQPPKTEQPGKGEAEAPVRFDPRDLAGMTDEEQAEMLIKLGLV